MTCAQTRAQTNFHKGLDAKLPNGNRLGNAENLSKKQVLAVLQKKGGQYRKKAQQIRKYWCKKRNGLALFASPERAFSNSYGGRKICLKSRKRHHSDLRDAQNAGIGNLSQCIAIRLCRSKNPERTKAAELAKLGLIAAQNNFGSRKFSKRATFRQILKIKKIEVFDKKKSFLSGNFDKTHKNQKKYLTKG